MLGRGPRLSPGLSRPAGAEPGLAALRVGLLLDDSLDRTDGVQQHVLTLGRWLTRQGHEVHYVASTTTRCDLPHLHEMGRGVPVRFNGNTLTTPATVSRRALGELVDARLDVLHVAMPYSPLLAGRVIAAMPASVAVLGTFHIVPASRTADLGVRLLGLAERRRLRRFDGFVAVSQVAARYAHDAWGIDTEVIPNPVELAGFRGAPQHHRSGPVRVVFLGRLVPRKGPLELVAAVDRLVADGLASNDFRVVVAGDGALRTEVAREVDRRGLGGVVELVGRVPEPDKAALLAGADVVVLPSVAGESFGISVVEALAAAGGPVLVGDNAGYREVVGPLTGLLVDPCDPDRFARALAGAIDALPDDRAVAEQRRRAETFDVERVGPQVVDAYARALARRR